MSANKPFVRLRMEAGDGTSWDYTLKPYHSLWALYKGSQRVITFTSPVDAKAPLREAVIKWAMRDLS